MLGNRNGSKQAITYFMLIWQGAGLCLVFAVAAGTRDFKSLASLFWLPVGFGVLSVLFLRDSLRLITLLAVISS